MLDTYYQLAKTADKLGLTLVVDKIDRRMLRLSQVVPNQLNTEQYIQDIYRRLTALSAQVQEMQQMQQATPAAKKNYQQNTLEQTGIQTQTQMGNPSTTSVNLNNQPHNFEITE